MIRSNDFWESLPHAAHGATGASGGARRGGGRRAEAEGRKESCRGEEGGGSGVSFVGVIERLERGLGLRDAECSLAKLNTTSHFALF